MHADQLDIGVELVRRLVAAQFPQWAVLSIEPVPHRGTDNALFRLGAELVARLPIQVSKVATLLKEIEWLPRLAPHLPLAIPTPVAEGDPGEGYPCRWAVYQWLPGENPIAPLADPTPELTAFIRALQEIDGDGAPTGRGVPLAERDAAFRASLARLDLPGAAEAWAEALEAPVWEGRKVWAHGDLDRRNVLVRDGRITAVVDWGALGAGDPACEVMVAWKLVPAADREAFREALGVDDATWARARGWALSQAVIALGYYTEETNPALVAEARRWLRELGLDAR